MRDFLDKKYKSGIAPSGVRALLTLYEEGRLYIDHEAEAIPDGIIAEMRYFVNGDSEQTNGYTTLEAAMKRRKIRNATDAVRIALDDFTDWDDPSEEALLHIIRAVAAAFKFDIGE